MAIDLEAVASLAKFVASQEDCTIENIIGLIGLVDKGDVSAIAFAIDKGITLDDLRAGLCTAVFMRLGQLSPVGTDGESLMGGKL